MLRLADILNFSGASTLRSFRPARTPVGIIAFLSV